MELPQSKQILYVSLTAIVFFFLSGVLCVFWLLPAAARRRLWRGGFDGPRPRFPLGNIGEMCKKDERWIARGMSHNIHSIVFPYFATWRNIYGKVFIYWLGTEPFIYAAEPEFLSKVTTGGMGKKWGKPDVFKHDRKPMFGKGLVMAEGEDWSHHRNIIARAFSVNNLNAMLGIMVDSTTSMLNSWSNRVAIGFHEIDVENDIARNAAEIIAKISFGISQENGKKVFEMLQAMQLMLFSSNRLVGVPFSKILSPIQSYRAWKLGKRIDQLLLAIINSRREDPPSGQQQDLLGFMLAGNEGKERSERKLTSRDLVDECKTFFFGGHETTALALIWTLLLLAIYPEWQKVLREEIEEVSRGETLSSDMLARLTKMGWVRNEVLRLYSPAPNAQRQAKEKVVVGDIVIPKGTNMWIDVVGMHHDPALWGDDVNEFKPERFKDNSNGGCKHRMGFLPFGFGGRTCIGRNLAIMEYNIVLSLILRNFFLLVSPTYIHSPNIMLSLRPSHGVPLMLRHL